MTLNKKRAVDKIFTKLKPYTNLNSAEKKLVMDHAEIVHFKPNENFIEVGNVINKIGFIVKGIFRFFKHNDQGEEITKHFYKEDEFLGDIYNFKDQGPSSGTFQAETTSSMIVFYTHAWGLFCNEIPSWVEAIGKYSNDFILTKTTFQREQINLEAQEKYQKFTEHYPTIVYEVPLGHIATFLGINQSTLSRIRGNNKK